MGVFFALNKTAANSLALAAICQSYHCVICAESADVETDECGAPEFFSNGSKLLVALAQDGKLTLDRVRAIAVRRSDIHYPKPRAVMIRQSSETGRVYTMEELRALSATCRVLSLHLHMDGERFTNACAALKISPAELTWKAVVDVLCFGGTKNGMAVSEAILFFNAKLAEDFECRCKQAGQLASKMRFLAKPWLGMLKGSASLRNGAHANACAQRFAVAIEDLPGVRLMFAAEASAVVLSAAPLWWKGCRRAAGASTPLSAVARASRSRGIRVPRVSTRSPETSANA